MEARCETRLGDRRNSPDMESTSMMDSQELRDFLSSRHFIEFESESEGESDEELEVNEEGMVMVMGCLLISLFSPVTGRAAAQRVLLSSLTPPTHSPTSFLTPPSHSPLTPLSPLSPLSLLSRKLGLRGSGQRGEEERREMATQTSTPSLHSPSVASSGLPSLSPCSPPAAHLVDLQDTLSPRDSFIPTRDSYTTTSSSQDAGPKDSLQDIIFDAEETARVRAEQEMQRMAACSSCKEKQKEKSFGVRFAVAAMEDKIEEKRTRKAKKKPLCGPILNIVHTVHKLIRKFKSRRLKLC